MFTVYHAAREMQWRYGIQAWCVISLFLLKNSSKKGSKYLYKSISIVHLGAMHMSKGPYPSHSWSPCPHNSRR